MSCKDCATNLAVDKVTCVVCKNNYCFSCAKIEASEQKIAKLRRGSKFKFFCDNCSNKYVLLPQLDENGEPNVRTMVMKLLNLIEEQSEKIKELEKSVQEVKRNQEGRYVKNDSSTSVIEKRRSYANLVNEPVLIVKPNDGGTSVDTLNEIQNKIDPIELAIGIDSIKKIKDGGVVIGCADEKSREVLKKKVMTELGDTCTVNTAQLKNPRVIIVGVEEKVINMEDKDIINALVVQNENTVEDDCKIKVIKKFITRKNSGNIVLEVDPEVMKKLMEVEKIHMKYRNCRIYEYFNVIRCFDCGELGHKRNECKKGKLCFNCFKKHNRDDECQRKENPFCINCQNMNTKVNMKLDVNHSIFNKECPCYQRVISTISAKVKKYSL